jgi:hypothetical protein
MRGRLIAEPEMVTESGSVNDMGITPRSTEAPFGVLT